MRFPLPPDVTSSQTHASPTRKTYTSSLDSASDSLREPDAPLGDNRSDGSLQLGSQQANYVIGSDHASQLIVLIDNRQCYQVVLIEQFGEFHLFGVLAAGD